jgi:prepilin-type processing-associated H-X9-DG protein
LSDRHLGGGMLAYGDGHVDYMTQQKYQANLREIFRLTPSSRRQ